MQGYEWLGGMFDEASYATFPLSDSTTMWLLWTSIKVSRTTDCH